MGSFRLEKSLRRIDPSYGKGRGKKKKEASRENVLLDGPILLRVLRVTGKPARCRAAKARPGVANQDALIKTSRPQAGRSYIRAHVSGCLFVPDAQINQSNDY